MACLLRMRLRTIVGRPPSAFPLGQYVVRRCGFHTTTPNRAVPPLVVVLMRYVAKIGMIIFGRKFRKWWQALPPERKAKLLNAAKEKKVYIAGGVGCLSIASYQYYLSHLQATPVTNRIRFLAFTPEQMMEIGQHQTDYYLEKYKILILPDEDPNTQKVVRAATRLLKANRDLPQVVDKDWTITVINLPLERNAFVLPNGSIFVFRGMLDVAHNEDQLGCILGHEVAHAILGHGVSYMHLVDLAMIVAIGVIWAVIPGDILALITQSLVSWMTDLMLHLPFGRSLEIEADEVGLMLAAKACFDVREVSAFWGYMALQGELDEEEEIEWLSTHPNNDRRQYHLDELIPNALKIRKDYSCPLLTREDPRQEVERVREAMQNDREEAVAMYGRMRTRHNVTRSWQSS